MRTLLPLLLGLLTLVVPVQAGERLTSRPRPTPVAVKPLAVGDEVRTETGQRRRVVLPDGSILYVNQQSSLKIKAARQVTLDKGEVFVEVVKGEGDFTVQTRARELTTGTGSFAVRAADGTGILVTRGKVKVDGLDTPILSGQTLSASAKQAEASPRGSELLDWTRELMMAAEPRLVPQSEHGGGALIANSPAGEPVKLTLRKFHIDVFVEEGFARTTIDQTYFNHHTGRLEGTFYFPLPADASLSQLAMYVGENLMEGGMVDRDYGRSVYERIVHSQQDPALLEWLDGTTFKMRVFPIEARQEKRVILSYTQKLSSFQGRLQYRFPAGHSLEAVADWSLAVRVKNGEKLAWKSASHTLDAKTEKSDLLLTASAKGVKLDKDVVLDVEEGNGDKVAARFSVMEQDGAKYLMVRYRPDWPATPRRERRDWVVLFESSGDRNPLLARAQIEVIRGLLQQAEPDDTLTVATAATRLTLWKKEAVIATPENIESALTWLDNAHLLGALDLDGALAGLDPILKTCKNAHLVHLGTGIPALGERRQEVLLKRLPEGSHYIGIGVGKRWNRALMKEAAERTGGYFTQINPDESISWRTFELAATLNSPRMLNVSVSHNEGKNRWLTLTTLLSQGEEVCAVTRLDAKEPLPKEVEILGWIDNKGVQTRLVIGDVAKEASYLPRHWARLEIDRELANPNDNTYKKVVELSKAMYVMTPYTSLLVLENDDMYTQYKVERNRKDLWAAYPAPKKIAVKTEGPIPASKPTREQVLNTIVSRTRPNLTQPMEQVNELRRRIEQLKEAQRHVRGAVSPEEIAELDAALRSNVRADSLEQLGVLMERKELVRAVTVRAPRQSIVVDRPSGDTQDNFRRPAQDLAFSPDGASIASTSSPLLFGDGSDPMPVSGKKYTVSASVVLPATPLTVLDPSRPIAQDPLGPLSVEDIRGEGGMGSLLYQPLTYRGDDRLFHDLLHYAPGMDTNSADVFAVLENEAIESEGSKPGKIDDKARTLFEKARKKGWQKMTMAARGELSELKITFDAEGRYAYERILPPGITEIVICDGKTIWHVYPDLHLAAKRTVSRFHRIALSSLVPVFLPPVEDLARGADLVMRDERTAALVPFGAGKKDKEGKVIPYVVVEFSFADDGTLKERRNVQMPDKKVLRRQVYGQDAITWFDGEGKESDRRSVKFEEGKEPKLEPKLKDLVVLDLPYRTPEHVRKVTKTENKDVSTLTMAEGLPLLGAYFGQHSSDGVANVFRTVFANRDQHQLGFYVLMASCGRNLDSQNDNVLNQHRHEPLAQYLALYSSPLLREHASQWATGSGQWKDNFMQRLAVTHSLLQRWQNASTLGPTDAVHAEELTRASEYIRTYPDSPFSWTLLTLIIQRTQERERQDKDVKANWEALVKLCELLAKKPEVTLFARYEHARALWKTGKTAEAVAIWRKLFEEHREQGTLLRIDSDFRTAFQAAKNWNDLLSETGKQAVSKGQRDMLVTFAWQLWQLGDSIGAGQMVEQSQTGIKDNKERETLRMLALQFYWQTRQHELADQHLRTMLVEKPYADDVGMWRFAVEVATKRSQPRRILECLEKASDLAAKQGDKIDARIQTELNRALIEIYAKQAESLLTLQVEPPADFRTKVIKVADRWRATSPTAEGACLTVATILRTLGDHELAWDYMTTPVAESPYESGPWAVLARRLIEYSEPTLADRAYAAAFDAERTNAQLLWDRAQMLRQGGKVNEAKKVLRQLAEGEWQPRFRNLQEQAKAELDR